MVVLWLCLWTLAAITFFIDPKNNITRWGSAIAFFGGFGGLSVFTAETLSPYIRSQFYGGIPAIDLVLNALEGVGASFGHYLAPFSVLMFALRYTNPSILKRFSKRNVTIAAFTPAFLMYIFFPCYPKFNTNYILLTTWVGPYILLSNILLIRSWFLEKHISLKKQKLFTCLIIVPTTFFCLMTNIVLRAFKIEQLWRYNTLIIVAVFIAFFYFCINYEFLGIKLRFEKERLDNTIRAVSLGATILNHNFKNEIGKIHILADRIQHTAKLDNQIDIKNDAGLVIESADHMLKMIARIQKKLSEIVLDEQPHDFQHILEQALLSVSPYIEMKGIQVTNNFSNHVKLLCDEIHLQEILRNIFYNAIEAMPYGGRLQIEEYNTNRNFVIAIKDTGCGITKENLDKVLDPFFTTKNRKTNYGLGLSYCYKVLQKHGGSLELQSKLDKGTTVTLYFPNNRVLTSVNSVSNMEVINEKNKSTVS